MLKTLSQLLDSKRPMLTVDDLAALPDDLRDLLSSQQVLVPARSATHVTRDACHDDHVEEVSRIKDASGEVSFRIICPDAGWVQVPAERLRQWTLDIRRLATVLASSISSETAPEELVSGVGWRIGAIEIAGVSYDLVFLRNGNTDQVSILKSLGQKASPASTVIISSSELQDQNPEFAASVALSAAFASVDGHIEFQPDRIRASLATSQTANGNVFQQRGEFWQLSFDGNTIFLKDTIGLGYIAQLLREPNRYIPAVTLHSVRSGLNPLAATGSSGEVLDSEARGNYEERYRTLADELDDARQKNDLGQIEKLESEMEQLAEAVANATGLGGRTRELSDIEKVRKSVSGAVSRDLERISNEHESLGRHLTTAISSGRIFRYAPEREIDWLT